MVAEPSPDQTDEQTKRFQNRNYEILVNDISGSCSGQSIHEALRKAGDLRLQDTDTVIVRLAQ